MSVFIDYLLTHMKNIVGGVGIKEQEHLSSFFCWLGFYFVSGVPFTNGNINIFMIQYCALHTK